VVLDFGGMGVRASRASRGRMSEGGIFEVEGWPWRSWVEADCENLVQNW
jgi:hypothetical protein